MRTVPDEILELILVFSVRGHRDMRTLALTCKRWRSFSQQDISWKRLSIRGWGNRSDIIQIPIEKDPGQSWYTYYRQRILSHLPELCYLKSQQHMTVSIRYKNEFYGFDSNLAVSLNHRNSQVYLDQLATGCH